MPDEQQKQWVKVRARQDRGFYRLGRQWTVAEQFAQLTEDEVKRLEQEPMLVVTRVSAGEVPQAEVDSANAPQNEEQQRELLRNAEFPLLTAAPGGQPVRTQPPVLPHQPPPEPPQNPNVEATKKAVEQPFENAGVSDPNLPPKENEPEKESHFFSSSDSTSKKKR